MSSGSTNSALEGAGTDHPQVRKALNALRENRPLVAEILLRRYLEQNSQDVTAMAILAEALMRLERFEQSAELLTHAIELAPNFVGARHNYVNVLLMQNKPEEAFAQISALIDLEPNNPNHRALKAMANIWVGDHASAAAEYENVLAHAPKAPAP